jgi:predicted transcriptional regulator
MQAVLPEESYKQKLGDMDVKPRRGQIEIFLQILTLASPSLVSKGVTKTHLGNASGLNFHRLEKYLDLLVQRKLIEKVVPNEGDEGAKGGSLGRYETSKNGERVRSILLEAERLILGGSDLDNYATPLEERW